MSATAALIALWNESSKMFEICYEMRPSSAGFPTPIVQIVMLRTAVLNKGRKESVVQSNSPHKGESIADTLPTAVCDEWTCATRM